MAFDAGELESAISSVIFEIVEREKSVSSAASQVRCTSVVSIATVVFQCVILSVVVWLRKKAKIKDENNCAVVYVKRSLIVQSLLFLLENTVTDKINRKFLLVILVMVIGMLLNFVNGKWVQKS